MSWRSQKVNQIGIFTNTFNNNKLLASNPVQLFYCWLFGIHKLMHIMLISKNKMYIYTSRNVNHQILITGVMS